MTPRQRLTAMANIVIADTRRRYAQRRDPDGIAWQRNAPKTVQRKKFNDPMRETGETLATPPRILARTATSIEVGYRETTDAGRRVAENSVADPDRNRPARAVMGLGEAPLAEIEAVLLLDLTRAALESW